MGFHNHVHDTGTGDREMPFDREFILGRFIVIFFKNPKSGHLIVHDQASAFVRNFSHFRQGTKPNFTIKRPPLHYQFSVFLSGLDVIVIRQDN